MKKIFGLKTVSSYRV